MHTMRRTLIVLAIFLFPLAVQAASPNKAQARKLTAEPEIEKQTWEPATISASRLERDPEGLAMKEFKRAVKHLRKNRFAESLPYLDKARAIDPEFADAYLNAGVAHFGLKNPVEAIREFERALALDPRMILVDANLALVHLRSGNYDNAEAAARIALRKNPNDLRAVYALGVSRAAQGRRDDETIENLRRAADWYTKAAKTLAEIGDSPATPAIADNDGQN